MLFSRASSMEIFIATPTETLHKCTPNLHCFIKHIASEFEFLHRVIFAFSPEKSRWMKYLLYFCVNGHTIVIISLYKQGTIANWCYFSRKQNYNWCFLEHSFNFKTEPLPLSLHYIQNEIEHSKSCYKFVELPPNRNFLNPYIWCSKPQDKNGFLEH